MMVIVPNYIANEINAKLDAEIAKHPAAAKDRDVLYSQLLGYVNEHGVIPDFSLAPRDSGSGSQSENPERSGGVEAVGPQSGPNADSGIAQPGPSHD